MTDDLTKDDFLGGKLCVYQPRKGYRAGVDPVLLAASTPAKPGQSVLELGCGVGVASLCLSARIPGLAITGIELQADYALLASRNAQENNAPFNVVNADLRQLPVEIRQQRFDHVIMNPPYFDRTASVAAQDAGRDIALGGDTPLADWLEIGARRVGPRGYLTIIQRIERLPEVLSGLNGRLGALILRPIAGREDRAPELFLLQARQEGRAAFRMMPTLIMHKGTAHAGDKESYTAEVSAALRSGAELPILC
ncbi:tRNA1(Val) (adenine(37)-N6)-methyltransferase [Yoonia maritima]|uniref:tRNA1(Val) (adenine(37)-N6)-methyltransferase n=1 Tax=Yoonia maritima TaxID=1435347 RepID=UPI000D0EF4C9|nr:methyltransferase [Yoonia maritima]